MISVIIPTFNRATLVTEAVESVLSQRRVREEMEVIVIDDGSTDNTREALRAFDNRIRLFHREHSGVSGARNAGIARSRGRIIAFLDSDDLWLPDKLSAQLKFFAENPGIQLCQTEEIWIRNGERLNPRRYHKKPSGHCFPLLLERCLVSPSAVAIRRPLLDEVGLFDESLPACEDYDMWLRIGCRHPLGLIQEPLTIKRGGHSDQISATIPSLDRFRIKAILKLLCAGTLDPLQAEAAREALLAKARVYAAGSRKRGKTAEAESMEHLAREISLRTGPSAPCLLAILDSLCK